MNNKKKKDLAKIALTAFILAAALPVVSDADEDMEMETETSVVENQGCGARLSPAERASRARPSTSATGAGPRATNEYEIWKKELQR